MGRNRNVRLPDDLESDAERYMIDNKIKFTDLVIAGITSIIYSDGISDGKHECNPMPEAKKINSGVLQEAGQVSIPEKVVLQLEKPAVSSGVYFNPQPKKQPQKPTKQPYHSKPEPEKSPVASPGAVDKPATKLIIKTKTDIPIIRRGAPVVQHHPQCKCVICKP